MHFALWDFFLEQSSSNLAFIFCCFHSKNLFHVYQSEQIDALISCFKVEKKISQTYVDPNIHSILTTVCQTLGYFYFGTISQNSMVPSPKAGFSWSSSPKLIISNFLNEEYNLWPFQLSTTEPGHKAHKLSCSFQPVLYMRCLLIPGSAGDLATNFYQSRKMY